MRILAVSDKRSPSLYDYYSEGKLSGFDLILGCGDLDGDYLEYLMTMANCPLVYVHGNHDDNRSKEPLGCICADFKVVEAAGLRIFGLPGSYKYRDGKYMYSERRMKRKILQKWPGLRMKGGFDSLRTHAPARHLNDLETIPHRGFECFHLLLNRFRPKLFVHGHVHRDYAHGIPQRTDHNGTLVVNACDHAVIEIP